MARPLELVHAHARPPAVRGVDEFGFDLDYTERVLPFMEWVYRSYFRVETQGLDHVPAHGRALLVANHGGVVPWDGAMIRTAIRLEHSSRRHARMLVLDWAFAMPFLSRFMIKTGNVLAHPDNAIQLLRRDELVGVFPEGAKGATKGLRHRYRVNRFGRGGFVQVALRTGAPIIPVAVVGAEETHPVIADLGPAARLLRMPILPITPTFPWLGPLGMLPLPSKWFISFGPPLDTTGLGADAAEDPSLVLDLGEQVRAWIQQELLELLPRRRTPFG
ncbi:MAG TPA: lysophospholipid acyltransferase family protein [Candidatus Dormibacteraeota bacterium]